MHYVDRIKDIRTENRIKQTIFKNEHKLFRHLFP